MHKLHLIAVTGSHGKSITANLIAGVLKARQAKTVVVDADVSIKSLYRRLIELWHQDVNYAVLIVPHEVMKRSRLPGVRWDIAVLTNLVGDYRGYGDSFNEYGERKLRLFKKVKPGGTGVVNANDVNAPAFLDINRDSIGYGIGEGGVRATNIVRTAGGFRLTIGESEFDLHSHNSSVVSYALAAVAVGQKLGLSDNQIAKKLGRIQL